MTDTAPLHAPGTEIARLRLPVGAADLAGLTWSLERAYGKGLRLKPDGGWFSVRTPTEKEAELDRRRAREARRAQRQADLEKTFPPTPEGATPQ